MPASETGLFGQANIATNVIKVYCLYDQLIRCLNCSQAPSHSFWPFYLEGNDRIINASEDK